MLPGWVEPVQVPTHWAELAGPIICILAILSQQLNTACSGLSFIFVTSALIHFFFHMFFYIYFKISIISKTLN